MSSVSIGWSPATPANSDLVGQGAAKFRSLQTAIQSGLSAEHVWPDANGNAGAHKLGSARVFVGPSSQVSSADTTGRLMWNSTSSQLVYVGAEGTAPIGGVGGLSVIAPVPSATSRFVSYFTEITGNSWPTGPLTTPFLSGSSPVYWVTVSTNSSSVQSVMLGQTDRVPIPVVLAQNAGTSPQVFLFNSSGSLSNETWTVNIFGIGTAAL